MLPARKSYLFALASVLLWSTVATAFKISLRHVSPIELLFIASVTSCCVLTIILYFRGQLPSLLKLNADQWLFSLKYGFLNPFLYYLVLFSGYDILPAQQAQAINYTWAITLSLLSVPLLKQKITKLEGLAVVIGYAGVVVISVGRGDGNLEYANFKGIFLTLLSTVIWAFYWIKNTSDRLDPVVRLLANFLCGLPFIIAFMVFEKGASVLVIPSLPGVLGAVYVGIFEMGVTFVFWLAAMKYAENTVKIANLIFLSPILSLFFIHYIAGEQILPNTVYGLGLILFGLALQTRAGRAKNRS